VGYAPTLGGLPVDAEVEAICARAARRFADAGANVEAAAPDFAGAQEAFQTLRAVIFVGKYGPLLDTHREQLKPEVVWNIEKGLRLDVESVARANRLRAALYERAARFFATYDVLATPVVIVPPFPVERRFVDEVMGHRFDNYVDWLGITYMVTLIGCPALSLPCGFTAAGLPVGLQLVGRPRGEAPLLAAAALLEAELGLAGLLPIDPRPAPHDTRRAASPS
jgi:amidase